MEEMERMISRRSGVAALFADVPTFRLLSIGANT
jgi:hypothetical protein